MNRRKVINKRGILQIIVLIVLLGASAVTKITSAYLLTVSYCGLAVLYLILWKASKEEKLRDVDWKHKYLMVYFWSAVQIFSCFLIHRNIVPIWDSNTYFSAADIIWKEKSLFAYTENLRGVALPLVCTFFKNILYPVFRSEILSYGFFTSIIFGLLFAVLFPRVLEWITHVRFSAIQLMLPVTIISVTWWGLLVYPLSDIWALFFLVLAIYLIQNVIDIIREKPTKMRQKIQALLLAAAGGGAIYLCYNIRTAYLYAGILLIGTAVVIMLYNKSWLAMGSIIAILIGAFCTALPQTLLNQYSSGSPSIFVKGPQSFSNGMSLQAWQCVQGIQVQRFDGYIGDPEIFRQGPMYFTDQTGQLLAQQKEFYEIVDLKSYIGFVLHYPEEMAGILTRHLFNLMNNCYPETYVRDVQRSRLPESMLCALLWFGVGVGALWKWCENNWKTSIKSGIVKSYAWMKQSGIWLLILLLTSLLMIPGAVEVRFFFPAYVIAYYFVVSLLLQKKFIDWLKHMWCPLVILGFLGCLTLNAIWGSTFASLSR